MRERKLLQGCLRKGSGIMEELASELLKELNCDTAFSIKLPAGLPLIGEDNMKFLGKDLKVKKAIEFIYDNAVVK